MEWKIDKQRPICPQLCEQICVLIASGEIAAGAKLFSVREVALEAGVNPNTVQKSFEELERYGLIYSVRGTGWFVREETQTAKEIVAGLIKNKTKEYFESMNQLGVDKDGIKKYVEGWSE